MLIQIMLLVFLLLVVVEALAKQKANQILSVEQVVELQVNKVDIIMHQEVVVGQVAHNLREEYIQVKLVEEHALVEHLYVQDIN